MTFHLPKPHHQRKNYKFTQFQNILSLIYNRQQYLKTSYFLIIWKKKASFVNFKNNIISDVKKIISEKIKTELKTFKTDSLKELSESLTWYKNETNVLKEECKSKDMIIAKLSKTIENLTNKKPEVISRDVQTNSNQPTKEPPLWEIMSMSELSSNSDGTQEEVTESSNFKQPKINLKQQLEQVRLQKKLEYNNYQSQQRDKISSDKISIPQELALLWEIRF